VFDSIGWADILPLLGHEIVRVRIVPLHIMYPKTPAIEQGFFTEVA